jgi:hypothetical protein
VSLFRRRSGITHRHIDGAKKYTKDTPKSDKVEVAHSWRRTLTKGFTYRLTGIPVSMIAGGIVGVSLNTNLLYSFWVNGISMVVWLAHELAWRKTKWGKKYIPQPPVHLDDTKSTRNIT